MQETNDIVMAVSPKSPDSRWVTLGSDDSIISEGKTPDEAISLAKQKTDDYFLMFVPIAGNTYVF